jgi:hypothetical protein
MQGIAVGRTVGTMDRMKEEKGAPSTGTPFSHPSIRPPVRLSAYRFGRPGGVSLLNTSRFFSM